jgi:ribonuclease P protein component
VSKAVGNAVQRNVVRRRLRAIVRPLVTTPQEPARGFDVIIRALPAARDASFDALTADVTAALRQARSRVRVGRP